MTGCELTFYSMWLIFISIEFYKKSIKNSDNSEAEFMEAFHEDLHHLLNLGIDPDDVPIMMDQLRYYIAE